MLNAHRKVYAGKRNLLTHGSLSDVFKVFVAGRRWQAEDCEHPDLYNNVQVPETQRTLKVIPKVPDKIPVDRRRKNYLIRGPCLGENAQLMHGQFGIIALKGGFLKSGHFNLIQQKINRMVRKKQTLYAHWRLEAPYHPVTRHPIQAVMGGGKGKISHYVTPVKNRQVIVEVGGKAQFVEVYPTLRNIAMLLPVPAIAVDKQMLEAMYEEERRIEDENENFFTFREIITKNMQGIRSKITKYDFRHFGKMR